MTLFELKWLAAVIIFTITLLSGLLSISLSHRFRKQLEIGDAIANGIFIGAALFHLLPGAIKNFQHIGSHFAYTHTFLLLIISYLIFWLIEKVFLHKEKTLKQSAHVTVMVITLSIHAAIAGITLGSSKLLPLVSILFIAIVAHKGFETFAFVINIYRRIGRNWILISLLFLFSLITPLGIFVGMLSTTILPASLNNLPTAYFSAIAAGTFLYIGTAHSYHLKNQDSYQQYTRLIATLIGILLMAIVGIWV